VVEVRRARPGAEQARRVDTEQRLAEAGAGGRADGADVVQRRRTQGAVGVFRAAVTAGAAERGEMRLPGEGGGRHAAVGLAPRRTRYRLRSERSDVRSQCVEIGRPPGLRWTERVAGGGE